MTGVVDRTVSTIARGHVADLAAALADFGPGAELAADWGRRLAGILLDGGRLLVVGNGGSAAQAQHLSSEVVGRYRDDRPPFSAVAVHTEPSALTAIANDYGIEEMFARQVQAHGRAGDLAAVETGEAGLIAGDLVQHIGPALRELTT